MARVKMNTAAYRQQGKLHFAPGYKLQTRWGANEALIFTLEGAGGSLVAASLLADGPRAAVLLGTGMVAVAILLLLMHLGHPLRAWRAILNVRGSWISRGTFVLGSFVALGVLRAIAEQWGLLDQSAAIMALIRWMLVAGGVFIALYPGLVLSASSAIPFWNSGLLPVLSLAQGMTTGVLLLLAFAGTGLAVDGPRLASAAMWLLVAQTIVLCLYVASMLRRGGAGAESSAYLLRGHPLLFVAASCGLGVALPLALLAAVALGHGGAAALAAAALARLAGDLALRRAFLKVGMFDPVI